MLNKVQVQIVAAVTVLVFAIGIIVSGGHVESSWLRFYSFAAIAAVVVLTLWNRWVWRWRISQRVHVVPCDLNGTWTGTLDSQWHDPDSGSAVGSKPAFLVIRQTASHLSATMHTDEMRSVSTLANVASFDDMTTVDYIYVSSPASRVEHRSRMHRGATALDITGRPATRLHGRYWTDRDSRGELDFRERVSKHADDYESASELFKQEQDPSNARWRGRRPRSHGRRSRRETRSHGG